MAKILNSVTFLGSLFQSSLLFTKLRKCPVYRVKLTRCYFGSLSLSLTFLIVNKSYIISSFLLYLSNLQFHASFLICVPCCEGQISALTVRALHIWRWCRRTQFYLLYKLPASIFYPAKHWDLMILDSVKILIKQ